jgi:DNA-binding NarL/FixJ family response regulator
MKKIRIVLVDDHPVVRKHVRRILQLVPGIDIVGEASNGVEALTLVEQLAPDVLLLDMEMPVLNGVEVARRLRAANSSVRILALSAYDDKEYVLEMLANGASGYLTKDEMPDYIIEAVQRVAQGEQGWFSQRAAARVASSR